MTMHSWAGTALGKQSRPLFCLQPILCCSAYPASGPPIPAIFRRHRCSCCAKAHVHKRIGEPEFLHARSLPLHCHSRLRQARRNRFPRAAPTARRRWIVRIGARFGSGILPAASFVPGAAAPIGLIGATATPALKRAAIARFGFARCAPPIRMLKAIALASSFATPPPLCMRAPSFAPIAVPSTRTERLPQITPLRTALIWRHASTGREVRS